MDKFEKRIILLAGLLMGVFVFALLYNTYSRNIDVPVCTPYNKIFEKSSKQKIDDSTYQYNVVASMWAFDPGEIVIPEGTTIDFYLTSKDVVHGFNIDKKGVNLMAVPGGVNKATVKFNEPGIYQIVCHEFCGAGHQNMMGKIFVTSKYEKHEN